MADEKDDNLKKSKPGPAFPSLGVSDDRRETPIVNSPLELKNKSKLMANAYAQHAGGPTPAPVTTGAGMASVNPNRNLAWSKGSALRADTPYGQSPQGPIATQLHENFHLLFNRVAAKHGAKGRTLLAKNIFNAIPKDSRYALQNFVFHRTKGKPFAANAYHEEHLAHLLNYLNSPDIRESWHSASTINNPVQNDWHMKKAYKAVQRAAALADKKWVTRVLTPRELSRLHKSSDWSPSNEDLRHAMHMLSLEDESCPEFKAASFLANHYKPTDREIQEALSNNEGDLEAAALDAHRVPVNEENLKLLRKIMESSQELSKSDDMNLIALPRVVKPFSSDDIQMAQLVQRAFLAKDIHEVKLNGKHSKGASLFKNPEDETVWLLKPGSGSLSRAMGVTEESANQSRREVAFNLIGELLGLKAYLPKSHLLVIDGEDVAALEFFSNNFKTLNQIKNEKKINVQLVFEQFNVNGLLYKWAVMDYLLGQTDRHAGNLMMDDGFNIKFIDEGSAFAGSSYNPAKDPKSFVPFYLRVFSPKNFKVLSPEEKFKVMPHLNANADASLKYWIDHISEGQIVYLMNKYGLNPQPFIERLNKIRDYRNSKSEFIKKFYAGLLDLEEHLHVKNN